MAVLITGESRRVSRRNVHAPMLRLVKSNMAPHCLSFGPFDPGTCSCKRP